MLSKCYRLPILSEQRDQNVIKMLSKCYQNVIAATSGLNNVVSIVIEMLSKCYQNDIGAFGWISGRSARTSKTGLVDIFRAGGSKQCSRVDLFSLKASSECYQNVIKMLSKWCSRSPRKHPFHHPLETKTSHGHLRHHHLKTTMSSGHLWCHTMVSWSWSCHGLGVRQHLALLSSLARSTLPS